MALKTFLIDELHCVNKNINLIKNNMNNVSGITKSFSNKPNQEKPFISRKKHAKNISKNAATNKNIVPLANRFRNLMFD